MKIEKLIKIVKPLRNAELRKVVGGHDGNDTDANTTTPPVEEDAEGIIIDDGLTY